MSDHEKHPEWREHWEVALRFQQRGISELRDGDELVGSELIWGAAARAAKAAATRLGMPHGSHRQLFEVARRLAERSGKEGLRELLGDASTLHKHFYESNLLPEEVAIRAKSTIDFIEAVSSILGEEKAAVDKPPRSDIDDV